MSQEQTVNNAPAQTQTLETKLPNKELFSYAFVNFGQVLIFSLIAAFFMVYLEILEIPIIVIGGLMLGMQVFDAICDPIMGVIVDKVKPGKWGKCRTFMLITPIPVAIMAILLFAPVPIGSTFSIVYIIIAYLLFTIVYTFNDIPYWSMSAVITKCPQERVKVVSTTRMISGIGSALVTVIFMVIVDAMKSTIGLQNAFFLTVCFFAIAGAAIMLQGFFNTKERAIAQPTQSISKAIKAVFKCKPLMLNLVANMLNAISMVGMLTLTAYFVRWNVWQSVVEGRDPFVNLLNGWFNFTDPVGTSAVFMPVIAALPGVAIMVGLLLTPLICKKFPKRKVLIIALLCAGLANIGFYFIGYGSMLIFILGRFLCNIPGGIFSGVSTSMFGDSVDLLDHQTGKRQEGVCFSLLTFSAKFSNGIAAFIISGILFLFAFNTALGNQVEAFVNTSNIANGAAELAAAAGYTGAEERFVGIATHFTNEARGTQQPSTALHGIFMLCTLIMGIGQILMTIPFFFYKFDKKQHDEVLAAIKERNEKAAI
jgi:Na+/melibiose symporter-like transporter